MTNLLSAEQPTASDDEMMRTFSMQSFGNETSAVEQLPFGVVEEMLTPLPAMEGNRADGSIYHSVTNGGDTIGDRD